MMNVRSTVGVTRRVAAFLTALAATVSLVVGGAGTANAIGRDHLRADATGTCVWDAAGFSTQRCDVWSPSMQRTIPVLIQPSKGGGNAALYLLDGMRADPNQTGWVIFSDAPATYADSNINLVMPIGGAGSFYADWWAPADISAGSSTPPVNYKWETFLTQELPPYLEQNFGIRRVNNSILGLSMGATAAMNIAAKHPEQFSQVLSFSGYLNTTTAGMRTLLRLGMLSMGYNLSSLYFSTFDPRRFANDPYWNMAGLAGDDIYLSAGSGIWEREDLGLGVEPFFAGYLLERIARDTTVAFEIKARAMGLNPTVYYRPSGIHNWKIWTEDLHRTKDRVLRWQNAY